MKRKQWILCGAALLVATIGLDVVAGKDLPPKTKDGAVVAPANEISKTSQAPKANSADNADGKTASKTATPKPLDSAAAATRTADEEAIRLTGNAYTKAYGESDAKSIALLFTSDAEYIDEQGNLFQGREAIEGAMTTLFAENPHCKIAIDINSVRIVSPGVAIEDGTTMFTASDDKEPVFSRYHAVHVKANGKWLAASVREHAPKDRRQHRTQLQQLNWLQGEWVDESDDSVVVFSCEPATDGNYLVRKFVVHVAGREAMSGTQRIGWDPITGKLRAWTFDSDGGFNDGFWHRDDDRWILKSTGFTSDGQTASGTSIYTAVNPFTMTWQSIDREIAGVAQPDSDPVTIVRRSPKPETDGTPLSKSN